MARRTGAWLSVPLATLFAAGLAVSIAEVRPPSLPGIAMGSLVLLHAERAAALFALAVAIRSVLAQAARGRLPTQLTTAGLGYEAEATERSLALVAELQREVERLGCDLAAVEEAFEAGKGR